MCLGVSCGDIIMRCYRLGILVQKIVESSYLGILLPTGILVRVGFGVDVLMYTVLNEINTENLIRLNKYDWT